VLFIRPDSITFDGAGFFSKWTALAFNLTLTQALVPITSIAFSWNAVSWSISTEMLFYVAFPLLLVNIRNTWHWKLIGSAVVALLFIVVLKVAQVPIEANINDISMTSATYTNPLVRGFEFCLGMSTWVLWDRYVKHWSLTTFSWTMIELGVVALLVLWLGVGFYAVKPHLHFATLTVVFDKEGSCWLFAGLIAVMATGKGELSRLLSARACVFLGHISFSVYMLHQIMQKFFVVWLPQGATTPLMFFAALLFIASGSYLMIERPMQRFLLKSRASAGPVATPAQL
jgi:peptidoglycan/LPS O-acetylase OafA/YrhL